MTPRRTNVEMDTVSHEHVGRRIDNYLASRLRHAPKSLIYKLLRSGQVRVNGGRVKPHYRLAASDEIRIPPVNAAHPRETSPPRSRLDEMERAILYEDEHFLIVDKPAGLASHAGTGLSYGVIDLARELRPNAPRIDLAHRLDRDTSGCLVLSKHLEALREFHDALRTRTTVKQYRALLQGRLPGDLHVIDAALARTRGEGGEQHAEVSDKGKAACTLIEACSPVGPHSLVELRLVTGRMHQIRSHAEYIGHPVAGDRRYGTEYFNDEMRKLGLNRLFLHAAHLEFTAFNSRFAIDAPMPEALTSVLRTLGGKT